MINRILTVGDSVPPGQPTIEVGAGAVADPSRSGTDDETLARPEGLASIEAPSIYYVDTGHGRVGRVTFAVGCD